MRDTITLGTASADTGATEAEHGSGESLAEALAARIGHYTFERWAEIGLDNARINQKHLDRGQSIAKLRNAPIGEDDSAIIIGAGPSIERQETAQAILDSGFKGAVIATESGLRHCLPFGLVPDLVVTVDPRPRIVRWFGYPRMTLEELEAEDYYRVKDMDPFYHIQVNLDDPIRDLVNKYGKQMRIALPTVAYHTVVERALDVGMDIYWWNPMFDDPDEPDSVTRSLQKRNRLPSINAGGNVGSASWMMAYAVLGKKHIAITGMDYAVPEGTPYTELPHYKTCANLVGEENVDSLVVRIYNPFDHCWYLTDPTYLWYRTSFLEMVADADCKTSNCTEGGVLFSEHLEYLPLSEFLARHS